MNLMRTIAVVLFLAIVPAQLRAGEFRVMPIKAELSRDVKSQVVSIINEGKAKLTFQINASEWTQDDDGKDVYKDTQDLVYFPKIVAVDAGDTQVVRLAFKGPPPLAERAYRLFIQELPEASGTQEKAATAQVGIMIRFGVPVFVMPVKQNVKSEVTKFEVSKGAIAFTLKNTGNRRFNIEKVVFKGASVEGSELFSKDVSGWYHLSGVSRTYGATLPSAVCSKIIRLEARVVGDGVDQMRDIPVQKNMCSP